MHRCIAHSSGKGPPLRLPVQVRDGEMVAVELVATDCRGSMEAVLSLGCIQYDSTRSGKHALVNFSISL